MAWRLARSLEVLADEVRRQHPGTTVWTIGDAAHRGTWSDHNPNPADVVCAADFLPDGGLDLGDFAEHLRAGDHPALKYVIYDRRIASAGGGWRPYHGSNPHTGHVHVSVGRGPDGRSTGPYDDTSPWGLAPTLGGIMLPKYGDEGEHVRYWQRRLIKIGYPLSEYGPDGQYGDETQAAVTADREARGYTNPEREEISGWHAEDLDDDLAQLRAREAAEDAAGPAVDAAAVVDELARRLAGAEGED